MTIKKRFIAGAICPRCAAMDRLVMYTTENGTFRECVECGFEDRQVSEEELEEQARAQQLETRVTRKPARPEVKAQPIRFYPRKPTRH